FFESLDSQIRSENHCGSGKSLLSIDARNQVFTCPLEVSHKENMVGTGTYVKQEALDNLQNPLIELNKCGNCWARFVCGGGCLYNHKALTGDQHQKHPQYCVKTRSLLKTTILYYKQCRK
ncbi:MAG: SPASM domain-containing protein, partial [Bdellovibrionota bacterium]